ncbi:TIGR03118 family protein [Micromonospora sp. NPDC049679]|uniref:TIGR03118 family protein n=1 Tax=Micromonospora sp. NPDC049679 TaxID=3155920 RepID=UPI0033C127A9
MTRRLNFRRTLCTAVALTLLGGAAPAYADDMVDSHDDRTPRFTQINQVSDQASRQPSVVDPIAVNSWGLALGPDTPLWVANNGRDTATVYSGGVGGKPVRKEAISVAIPDGAPTGAVFNNTDDFEVPGAGEDQPARFIFVGEAGKVFAWNPQARGSAVEVAHGDGAIYKGATLLKTDSGNFLLATDFHNARIDVFDEDFKRVSLPAGTFQDADVPKGFAPFNVLAVDEKVYVTYAKQDAAAEDDVAGAGLGFVDLFTDFGRKVKRIASQGTLNAPWGLAIAPEGFGEFTGDLLVGNFGDGRIGVFEGDEFEGQLRDEKDQEITIDGLWALLPGTETTGGEGTLWFSAGPEDETHGLVGQLIPTKR